MSCEKQAGKYTSVSESLGLKLWGFGLKFGIFHFGRAGMGLHKPISSLFRSLFNFVTLLVGSAKPRVVCFASLAAVEV